MRRARGVLIGVSNIYRPKSENTLKLPRNKLRVFCSNLADATAPFGLTEHEVSALRLDYEPDPLRP